MSIERIQKLYPEIVDALNKHLESSEVNDEKQVIITKTIIDFCQKIDNIVEGKPVKSCPINCKNSKFC